MQKRGRFTTSMEKRESRNMQQGKTPTSNKGISVMKISSISSLMGVGVGVEGDSSSITLILDMEGVNRDNNRDTKTYLITVMSSN